MTTTRDDLLCRILLEPDNDALRLVLADWLEEYGNADDRARAEFIRVQCEIARMEEAGEGDIDEFEGHTCTEAHCPICAAVDRMDLLRRRERELWCAHAYDWMPCVGAPDQLIVKETCAEAKSFGDHAATIEYRSRRGFVEAVELDAAAWIRHGDDLSRAAPLREVRLTTWPDHLLSANLYHATVDFRMPGGRPPVSVRVSGPAWESSPRDVWTAIRLAWNTWWWATGIHFHFPTP